MSVCNALGCQNYSQDQFCSEECEQETARLETRRIDFWGRYELFHRVSPALRWEPTAESRNA